MIRLKWIDIARGIGVILVIIGHLSKFYEGIGQWIYSFHMPLFFALSGILFFVKKEWEKKPSAFLVSKLKGLAFPYVTISVANIVYDLILHGFEHAKGYIIDTILLNGIIALWFLPALFFSEMILHFWINWFRKHNFIAIVFLVIAICLATIYSCTGVNFIDYSGSLYYIFMCLNILSRIIYGLIFLLLGCLGIYFYEVFFSKLNNSIKISTLIICGVLSVCLYRFNAVLLSNCIIGNVALFYINAINGSVFIIGVSCFITKYGKILEFYGANSLVIFSTHFNFGLIPLAGKIWGFDFCKPVGIFLIVLIIETILVLVVNKYFRFVVSYKDFRKLITKISQR